MKDSPLMAELPFPVPDYRFDQKNEMFKRSLWDPSFEDIITSRFQEDVVYPDKPGWRKLDFAAQNAAWNVEWGFGMGNSRSNSGLYAWDGVQPRAERFVKAGGKFRNSPEGMSRQVKAVALRLGADLVGICRVHPNWVYSHEYNAITRERYPMQLPEGCSSAVVLAIEMDYRTLRSSSMVLQGVTTGLAYSKMAFVANTVAAFIRGLGYRAVPCGNDTALSVPLAMAAGLGEWSRMGLLITERFGPRVRLCKVFTDLPLEPDRYRPFGVVEFCDTCKTCAVHCPSQAIPHGDRTTNGPNQSNHSGVRKWYVNAEKCYGYWGLRRVSCTQCLRICPFNKPPGRLHDLTRLLIRKAPFFNRWLARLDEVFGYQKLFPTDEFWKR
jgi:reductive dehalogenase